MADVFISYKSERRLAAEYLAHIITDHGFSVWWDYGLLVGENFRDRIEREIRAARAVVVLWCPMSVQSRWVKDEASLAQDLGRIIPARVTDVALPFGFSSLDTLNLAVWDGSPKGEGLTRLIRAVEARTGKLAQRNEEFLGRLHTGWLIAGRKRLVDFPLVETEIIEPPGGTFESRAAPVASPPPSPPPAPSPRRIAIPMVYVPAGRYRRGLDPDQIDHIVDRMRAQQLNIDFDSVKDILSKEARADIQLPAFHIGETPVTNSQFAQFADETGYRTTAEHTGAETTWRNYRAEQPDNPVVHVSVHDAEAYCKWAGLSLATVDEWRRAYRGDDRRIYPWGDEFDAGKCNTAESCKGMETTPVRQFGRGRSPFGCFDMLGNVEEWTASRRNEDNTILGGSWCMSCELYGIPITSRYARPSFHSPDLGFRCVSRTP